MENPFTAENRQQRLQSADQIESVLKITSVPTFLIAATVLLLLMAFVTWGFLGTVTDKVYYSGVVFPDQGTTDVSLPNKGMIRTMLVHSGDHVKQGQSVALVSVGDSYSILTSTVEGTVISTKVDNEEFEAFEPIVSVVDSIDTDINRTILIAYVDNAGQRDLQVGMNAQVWPEDEKRDEIGYVRGVITSIDRYPTPSEEIVNQLKSTAMAEALFSMNEAAWQIIIELNAMPQDSTRYDWSFGQPHNVDMGVGTYCHVLTETQRRSMYQYLFGVKCEK